MKNDSLGRYVAFAVIVGGLVAPGWGRGPTLLVTAPREDVVVRRIDFADLNLTSATGQQVLQKRVRLAVRALCNESTGGKNGQIEYSFNMHSCSVSALSQARPQISRALLRAQDVTKGSHLSASATSTTITLAVR